MRKELPFAAASSVGAEPMETALGGAATFVDGKSELQPVQRPTRKEGINIVAVHRHLCHEQTRRLFLHYRGKGRPVAQAGSGRAGGGQIMSKQQRLSNVSNGGPMLWIIAATSLLVLAASVPVLAQSISFETDRAGAPPKGWTLTMTGRGAPKWIVERDDTAPSKGQVLTQSGEASYPLALKDGTAIKDGFVEVKFKPIAGSEDRAGGLVWRAKDANNYYVVRANALEDNVVLYKTVNGTRSSLDIVGRQGGYGVDVAVPANRWHTLRVEFAGTRFKVSLNGQPLFEVDDATFSEAGLVGLWTKADSVTAFDAFTYAKKR